LTLKRVKREQTEEEAGSHRGLCATEPPEEGSGSFFFALAVRAIFAPVALGGYFYIFNKIRNFTYLRILLKAK
jgi:hypothetical protein